MAFPTTPELDNFNRANGAPGANWTDDSIGAGSSGMFIGGTSYVEASGGPYGEMYWNPDSWTDFEFWADQTQVGNGTAPGNGIRALMSPGSAAADGYGFNANDSGTLSIHRVVDGDDSTTLDSAIGVSHGVGVWGLTVIAGEITVWLDGTAVLVTTDGTYSGPFFASLWGYNGGSASLNYRWDAVGGGEAVTLGPTPPAVMPDYTDFPKPLLGRRVPVA